MTYNWNVSHCTQVHYTLFVSKRKEGSCQHFYQIPFIDSSCISDQGVGWWWTLDPIVWHFQSGKWKNMYYSSGSQSLLRGLQVLPEQSWSAPLKSYNYWHLMLKMKFVIKYLGVYQPFYCQFKRLGNTLFTEPLINNVMQGRREVELVFFGMAAMPFLCREYGLVLIFLTLKFKSLVWSFFTNLILLLFGMAAMPILCRRYWWDLLNNTNTTSLLLFYQQENDKYNIKISIKIPQNHSFWSYISFIYRSKYLPFLIMLSLLVDNRDQ